MSESKKRKIASGSGGDKVNMLLVGTGEYTTGYGKESAKSDKNAGTVRNFLGRS